MTSHSQRERIRAGDADAFGEAFDEHAGAVYAHAVRMLGNRSAAEDAVSLTFLEAWRLRSRLRPDGHTEEGNRSESIRPWLLGIATNVVRNASRAARRHRAALLRVPLHDVDLDFADDVVGRMAEADELAAAHRALAQLRPKDRDVVLLCVWAGLDYAAAAEALDIPVGTVKSRLSRARARLRVLATTDVEPAPDGGQLMGDRSSAVRSSKERVQWV